MLTVQHIYFFPTEKKLVKKLKQYAVA